MKEFTFIKHLSLSIKINYATQMKLPQTEIQSLENAILDDSFNVTAQKTFYYIIQAPVSTSRMYSFMRYTYGRIQQ